VQGVPTMLGHTSIVSSSHKNKERPYKDTRVDPKVSGLTNFLR